MRMLLSLLVICAAVLAMLGLGPGPAHALPPTCQDLLIGRHYDCDVKDQNGGFHKDCFQFGHGDFQSEFVLSNAILSSVYACSCRAKGTATAPHFDQSKDFLCVYRDDFHEGTREAYVGKIVGRTVSGEIVTFSGFSLTFKCTEVPAC